MTRYRAEPEPEPLSSVRYFELGGPLEACPECRSMTLRTVTDGELTNFICLDCGCCWHLELGWVHRVDPDTCPGCPFQPLCRVSHRPRQAPGLGGADWASQAQMEARTGG